MSILQSAQIEKTNPLKSHQTPDAAQYANSNVKMVANVPEQQIPCPSH